MTDRGCLTSTELADKGFKVNPRGYWVKAWTGPIPVGLR
jgi:hypothetical protein